MSSAPFIAAAVAAPFGASLDADLRLIGQTLDAARDRGARLVVLPETALGGYVREDGGAMLPPALDLDGPEVAAVIRAAGETVVCFGLTVAERGALRNVALCVSGDGILGRHDKVHLPPAERFAYTPGDRFAAFDTPVGRMGMLVCYDKLFPEGARALALDGATTIAALSAWPLDRRRPAARPQDDRQVRHFDAIDVARAVENQVTWIASNMSGPWGPVEFLGSAKIVDPDGVVRACTGVGAGMAVAHVDPLADRAEVVLDVDHLADRAPAAYGVHHTPVAGAISG